MSEEEFTIQYLGFTPYLVYRLSMEDDFTVIELNKEQQEKIEVLESKQYTETQNLIRELFHQAQTTTGTK